MCNFRMEEEEAWQFRRPETPCNKARNASFHEMTAKQMHIRPRGGSHSPTKDMLQVNRCKERTCEGNGFRQREQGGRSTFTSQDATASAE